MLKRNNQLQHADLFKGVNDRWQLLERAAGTTGEEPKSSGSFFLSHYGIHDILQTCSRRSITDIFLKHFLIGIKMLMDPFPNARSNSIVKQFIFQYCVLPGGKIGELKSRYTYLQLQ